MFKNLELPLDLVTIDNPHGYSYVFGPDEKDIEIIGEKFSACTLLFHLHDCSTLTIRDCNFPNGIIILGKVDHLHIVDSNVKIIDSTLICREISVISTYRTKSCCVECVGSILEDVEHLIVRKNSTFVYENPFKQLEVHGLLKVIEKSSFTLICSTVSCDSLICSKSSFEFNNLEKYYDYSNVSDKFPEYSGLSFNDLLCNTDTEILFVGDNTCLINGKAYTHKSLNNLVLKKVIKDLKID